MPRCSCGAVPGSSHKTTCQAYFGTELEQIDSTLARLMRVRFPKNPNDPLTVEAIRRWRGIVNGLRALQRMDKADS